MFHTALDLEITLSWQNIGDSDVHVTYEPDGGEPGSIIAKGLDTTPRRAVELPTSKIVFTFDDIEGLSLKWELIDGSGQFNLEGDPGGWSQARNVFTIDENEVTFTYEEDGIVIVGVLDIGGLEV